MLLTHKSLKRQIYPRALEHLGGKKYTEKMLEKAQQYYFWPPRVQTPFLCKTCSLKLAQNHQALRKAHREEIQVYTWLSFWYRLFLWNLAIQLPKKKTKLGFPVPSQHIYKYIRYMYVYPFIIGNTDGPICLHVKLENYWTKGEIFMNEVLIKTSWCRSVTNWARNPENLVSLIE